MPSEFRVILYEPNRNELEAYDVMQYFRRAYAERVKRSKKYGKNNPDDKHYRIPKTFDEFKEFVRDESLYQFWGRCEYEIIIVDWPNQKFEKKIDAHYQIMNNIDLVTRLLMEDVSNGEIKE